MVVILFPIAVCGLTFYIRMDSSVSSSPPSFSHRLPVLYSPNGTSGWTSNPFCALAYLSQLNSSRRKKIKAMQQTGSIQNFLWAKEGITAKCLRRLASRSRFEHNQNTKRSHCNVLHIYWRQPKHSSSFAKMRPNFRAIRCQGNKRWIRRSARELTTK